jgi:small GTP-binding protein
MEVSVMRRGPPPDVRMLVAGDSMVGKSSLCKRLAQVPVFEALKNERTVVGDTLNIFYEYPNGETLSVDIIDLAGETKYATTITSYYRDIDGIFLLYDVTRRESFESLKRRWIPEIRHNCVDPLPAVFLIGTKTDLPEKAVPEREAEELALHEGFSEHMQMSNKYFSFKEHPTPFEKFIHKIHAALLRENNGQKRTARYREQRTEIILLQNDMDKAGVVKDVPCAFCNN